jgi:hypothetical protein
MHRDIGFLNEPKALWHHLFTHEDLVGNYTDAPARYRLGAEDVTDDLRESAHRIYGAYLAATFSRRVVDKYPELIFRVPFVQTIFSDAKFLFLVRDGWDTCNSIEKWSKRHGTLQDGDVHDWWGTNRRKWDFLVHQIAAIDPDFINIIDEIKKLNYHSDMAAVEWILSMKEGIKLMQKLPEDVMMIKYEDLTHETEKTLNKVIEFCELPHDSKFFNYSKQILSSSVPKKPFILHPAIESIFKETMNRLNYT